MNEFEKKLSCQPLRQVPAEWRAEILAAARATQTACHPPSATRRSLLATINSQLATLLWPHPKAWSGLAAVWVFIFILNFSMRNPSPVVAEKSPPLSPEVIAELKQQQKLYAELIGSSEMHDADRRPKPIAPQPRSGRVEFVTV